MFFVLQYLIFVLSVSIMCRMIYILENYTCRNLLYLSKYVEYDFVVVFSFESIKPHGPHAAVTATLRMGTEH